MDMVKLLELMKKYEASDLYLTEESAPMYRVEGVVRAAGSDKLDADSVKDLLYSVMSENQITEYEREKEINMALHYRQLGRFRLNAFVQRGSSAVVIRRIKSEIETIDDLGLPEKLKELSMCKRGLILVVGATGSGKSTSLAAMIKHRSQASSGHIITIEDPIEFLHQHSMSIISQREVGMDTNSYRVALKNAFRQTPDVVLLGEIRDRETMESTITFAETGHLCLATLHSNNAYQAIERIMNFFPVEQHKQIYMQLGLNLRGIVSQRLVPTKDGGRAAALEVMTDSPRVKDLVHKGEITELRETISKSAQFGMCTFDQSLYDLYRAEKITLEEALKNADSANNLRLRVKLDDQEDFAKRKSSSVRRGKRSKTSGKLELV